MFLGLESLSLEILVPCSVFTAFYEQETVIQSAINQSLLYSAGRGGGGGGEGGLAPW